MAVGASNRATSSSSFVRVVETVAPSSTDRPTELPSGPGTMSVLFETSLGDLVIDLEVEACPEICSNFLKVSPSLGLLSLPRAGLGLLADADGIDKTTSP